MALVDNAWYVSGSTTVVPVDLGTNANAAGATLTQVITVPAGSHVVVGVNEFGVTTAGSLSDGTNTFNLDTSEALSGNVGLGMIFSFYYSGAQTAITLTYTKHTTGDTTSLSAMYATGIATSSQLDSAVTAVAQGSSTAPSVTSGTPTQGNDWIVGFCAYTGTSTYANATNFNAPLTATVTQVNASIGGGHQNVGGSIATIFAPTLGTSRAWAAMIVGYKIAGTPTGWWATTKWAASNTQHCGDLIRQNGTPAINNERVFVCVASTSGTGTTGASEPTWTVTRGAKNTDNAVTWQEATGIAAINGDLTNTPAWNNANIKNKAITLGQVIQNVAGTLILICTTAGTAGNGAEPSWAAFTNAGATTADNTVTWTTLGASFSAWVAPHARLTNALTTNWVQAGNSVFVDSVHAESQSIAMTVSGAGTATNLVLIYCASNSTAPPTATTTGAVVKTTGASLMALSGNYYVYGILFSCGAGVTNPPSGITFSGTCQYLDNCALQKLTPAAANNAINFSSTAALILNNTTLQLGSTGDVIRANGNAIVVWKNTPSAIVGAIIPTLLFGFFANGNLTLQGIDLSALGSGSTIVSFASSANGTVVSMIDCSLGASVTVSTPPVEFAPGQVLNLVRCDSGATNYQSQRYEYGGTLTTSTSIYRSGGASDGTTAISWNIVTTANSKWLFPFDAAPIAQWNTLTGSNRTVTVYGLVNAAAVPNNDNIWIECEYLGSASSPLGSFANNTKANNLASGSPLTADSSSNWAAGVTARQNSHAYVIGNTISLASNPNRVFFCTTSGTTAGSEPGGYASAVDGGSVTDNTAIFRAACRFSMAVTLSTPQPQLAGYIYTTVKAAQASTTFYVDPLMVFS